MRPPALSVNNSLVTFEIHKISSITVIIFYCDIKELYIFSNPMLHSMFVMRFIIVHVSWMSILQKVLSNATRWHANFNTPMSECKQIFFVYINIAKISFIPISLGFLWKSMHWSRRQKGNSPNKWRIIVFPPLIATRVEEMFSKREQLIDDLIGRMSK